MIYKHILVYLLHTILIIFNVIRGKFVNFNFLRLFFERLPTFRLSVAKRGSCEEKLIKYLEEKMSNFAQIPFKWPL